MTLNEYQQLARRSCGTSTTVDHILNGVLGLTGESGECADIVKKAMFQGHPLDREHLLDECSDVLWYVAELAVGLGVTLEEVGQHNIDKLRKRYPEGFEVERSLHREGE
ncbi:MAG: nucleoside triphosphate pyrophosphohydrolase family protein [Eubacteriales bacterium]|nr:nucleoside triphosphate pyrophosphohydrolase family protein [Eubacteriales bacterium]